MDGFCTHWWEVWLNPDNGDYVVVLNENDRKRNANLNTFANDWNASNRFLSFPQRVHEYSHQNWWEYYCNEAIHFPSIFPTSLRGLPSVL